jgi:hypothetical protein
MSGTEEYASDGTTLVEVIHGFEVDGFHGQFAARPGGSVLCYSCHEEAPASDVDLARMRRTEGASDPADMVAVAGLTCPKCGAKGTVALKYGPESTVEDADVLRLLETR